MKNNMKQYRFLLPLLLAGPAIAGNMPPAQDRAAILGMAGEFAVTFHFEETIGFKSGYELKEPYTEDARELVVVAKDEPTHIELQHLLVVEGEVIKHWRQVWTFEDTRICEYQGHNTWRLRDLSAASAIGTWTQLVTQVDDSPRYESAGHAHHHHFQCEACGRVFDVHACPGDLSSMAPAGFQVSHHELTLYGLCADCRQSTAARIG